VFQAEMLSAIKKSHAEEVELKAKSQGSPKEGRKEGRRN
jgi:hypothetical protein